MTRLGLQDLWRQLEGLLREAVQIEGSRIGLEQVELINEFIEHNEFALARDQLVDALSDRGLAPLERTAKIIQEANRLMRSRD